MIERTSLFWAKQTCVFVLFLSDFFGSGFVGLGGLTGLRETPGGNYIPFYSFLPSKNWQSLGLHYSPGDFSRT